MSDEQHSTVHCGANAKNLGVTIFDKWVYWCAICGAAAKAGEGEPLNWQAPSGGDGAGQDARPTSAALFSQLGISSAASLQAYMQSLIDRQMASERCETARNLCIATSKIEAELKLLRASHDALTEKLWSFDGNDRQSIANLNMRMEDVEQNLDRIFSAFKNSQDE